MIEKKKFFDIEIPLLRTEAKGYADKIESLDGRVIKLDLTRMLRGKSMEANIKLSVKDGKAVGEIRKLSILGFYIKRMFRKSVSYVEDSFSTQCKNCLLRIKPFLITRKKVSRAIRKALREEEKRYLIDYVKDKEKDEIFSDIISGKLQRSLSLKLKKIYPLALCEIREISIEKEKQ